MTEVGWPTPLAPKSRFSRGNLTELVEYEQNGRPEREQKTDRFQQNVACSK